MSVYSRFPSLRVLTLSARCAAGIVELAAGAIDQVNHDVYRPVRDTVYVAATAVAELLADPCGDTGRPAYVANDICHS